MIINKLAQEVLGKYYDPKFNDRCTGKSTACALKLISQAIANPGKFVPVVDESSPSRSSWYDGGFTSTIKDVIQKLGLKYIKFYQVTGTMMYDPFEETGCDLVIEDASHALCSKTLYKGLLQAAIERNTEQIDIYSKAIQRLESTKLK